MDAFQRIAEVSAAAVAAGINPSLAALTLVGLSALGLVDPGAIPLIDSELEDPVVLFVAAALALYLSARGISALVRAQRRRHTA